MAEKRPLIGILACPAEGDPPFREPLTYTAMGEAASRLGADLAVFFPDAAAAEAGQLTAYRYRPGRGWSKSAVRPPDAVLERTFCSNAQEERAVRNARQALAAAGSLLLSGRLGGKLSVYRTLAAYPPFRPYLPASEPLRSLDGVFRRLEEQGFAFLKPDGGSQGVGCLRLEAVSAAEPPVSSLSVGTPGVLYRAEGRDAGNRSFTRSFADRPSLVRWLAAFTAGQRYLVQDYLRLTGRDGRPFDLRSLVQKDAAARWAVTGIAARRGPEGSMTANLHGGGDAQPAGRFLAEELGAERAEWLLREAARLSLAAARILEARCGRLAELGLDFAVDAGGRLWFLEANSRPGRAAFQGDAGGAERLAASRPVAYAIRLASARPLAFPLSV